MSLPAWPPVPGIMLLYRWLEGVQLIDILTFNVESEFFWVAISCKTPPNSLDKKATREHAVDMEKVKESLQGKHGFESQEQCQWALLPPTDVDFFVSGKIWAIARVGDTSDMRKVTRRSNVSTHCCSTRHRRNIQRSRGLWQ